MRRVTNPVKEAGGSTLVGGASVMIIEGYWQTSSLARGSVSENLKLI